MKLWPFSKKTEALPTMKPGTPHSKKMELPPGVMLASPDEPEAPFSPPQHSEAQAETSRFEADGATPNETQPSFEDLSHVTASPEEPAQNKTDLAGFFEQNQLELISKGSPLTPAVPAEALSQAAKPEHLLDLQAQNFVFPEAAPAQTPEVPDWMTSPATPDIAFSTGPLNNLHQQVPSPQQPASQPVAESDFPFSVFPEAQAASEPTGLDHSFLTPTDFVGGEANNTDLAVDLFSNFGNTAPVEEVSPQAANQAIAMPLLQPDFVTQPQEPAPEEGRLADSSFFMQPIGPELDFPAMGEMFAPPVIAQALSPKKAGFLSSEEPEVTVAPAESQSITLGIDLQNAVEEAFHPENQTEMPALLNLPDDALAPHDDNNFFETAGLLPLGNEPYETQDFSDDAFDLDSLLLGNSPPEAFLQVENIDDFDSEEAAFVQPIPELDERDHYFGDEAEGLKGANNTDSYDFGHYEDPDEPTEAFVLDAEPEPASQPDTLKPSIAYESYYAEPASELSFVASQDEDTEAETTYRFEDLAVVSPEQFINDLFASDQDAESPPEDRQPEPEQFLVAPEQSDREQPQKDQPESQDSQAATRQPTPPKPRPKPYTESLADHMSSFEQDVMLQNSRFLNHSIDHLVNSYFADNDQQAS